MAKRQALTVDETVAGKNTMDLFDVICDLDERVEDLTRLGYYEEAETLDTLSVHLKGFIELRLKEPDASVPR